MAIRVLRVGLSPGLRIRRCWFRTREVALEREHKLPDIDLRKVRAILNPNVGRARPPLRAKPECPKKPVPKREEQSEVHVTFTGPIHVVQSMYRTDGKQLLCRSQPVIHVRMLQDELHDDGEAEAGGDRDGQACQHQGKRSEADVQSLMQRVPDKAIEPVEALDTVMNGMKLPQPPHTMAEVMDQSHYAIGNQHCEQKLNWDREPLRPEV